MASKEVGSLIIMVCRGLSLYLTVQGLSLSLSLLVHVYTISIDYPFVCLHIQT